MPETGTAPDLCAKCGKERDTTGNPQWCKRCRADYQTEANKNRARMARGSAFAAGCNAMKLFLITEFSRAASGVYYGSDVAALIQRSTNPRMPDEEITVQPAGPSSVVD